MVNSERIIIRTRAVNKHLKFTDTLRALRLGHIFFLTVQVAMTHKDQLPNQ